MDINGDVNELDLDTDVVLIVYTVPIIMKTCQVKHNNPDGEVKGT